MVKVGSPRAIRKFFSGVALWSSTISAVVDARLQNLSIVRESGVDADVRYRFDAFAGKAEIGASGTYIFRIDQALTPRWGQ